jgi:hypothetical protein
VPGLLIKSGLKISTTDISSKIWENFLSSRLAQSVEHETLKHLTVYERVLTGQYSGLQIDPSRSQSKVSKLKNFPLYLGSLLVHLIQ